MIRETRHSVSEILSRQPIFRTLSGQDIDNLAAHTLEYRANKGEILFQKGDRLAGMHVMIAGQVILFLPSMGGSEKVIHVAKPGETFGEETLFSDVPSPYAAQVDKDCIVLIVRVQDLQAIADRNQAFSHALMANLCGRTCQVIDNMETCTQRSSGQRVAHFLAQQIPDHASDYDVRLDTSKQIIAAQLNLTPETFSRVLKKLSNNGYIRVDRGAIKVTSRDRLCAYAG
jgi:CRP/FNR family transcriptional regulator, dissimilatory nitrate respiration regulator